MCVCICVREYTEEDVAGLNISSSFFDENGYIKDDQEPEWSSGVYVCVCVCVYVCVCLRLSLSLSLSRCALSQGCTCGCH
jgi:hypothetical protein